MSHTLNSETSFRPIFYVVLALLSLIGGALYAEGVRASLCMLPLIAFMSLVVIADVVDFASSKFRVKR